jgi:acetylornithine deacetylase/succinyl-diaminopimelate desuccinylase-like protein
MVTPFFINPHLNPDCQYGERSRGPVLKKKPLMVEWHRDGHREEYAHLSASICGRIKELKMKRLTILMAASAFLFTVVMPGRTQANSKNNLQDKIRHYRKTHEHLIVKDFFEFLSIPNVPLEKEHMRENAAFIKTLMERRGMRVQILSTSGNPVIVGELKVKNAARTLLFYSHYDGQPVDPAQWTDSEPFRPVLRPGKLTAGSSIPRPIPLPEAHGSFPDDWRIYARGASDDKAPLIALLAAVDALKAGGMTLKNNIKFILDGEEEAGSPSMPLFLEKHKDLLKADILFMCDGPAYYSGDPTLIYGVRGITTLAITVYGPDTSLHSGHYGNWAPNPAMRLAQLLASMKGPNNKVLIKGFYDTMVPLSDEEKAALKAIPPYDGELMKLFGFAEAESGNVPLMEAILYPSLNINGLQSGWVGEQVATIVPSSAVASIDMRLVKGDDPAAMEQKVIEHIKAQGYHVVKDEPDRETRMKYPFIVKVVSEEKGYRASRASMDSPLSQSVIAALSAGSGHRPVLIPSLGGSLPNYIFEDTLKVPIIGIPIANFDNNQHQQNENIRIGHLWNAIETFAAVIMMK